MISQTGEYALRAVVHLARIGGGPATVDDIAKATQVPAGYLARVLRDLARADLLQARRGLGGGFSLARPAGDLTVHEVMVGVNAGIQRFRKCPLHLPVHESALCGLHAMLDEALARAENGFRKTTIQSLLMTPTNQVPLCTPRVVRESGDGA